MAFDIPQALPQWMKAPGRDNETLYGWDMIIGLPVELLNAALQQEALSQRVNDSAPVRLNGKISLEGTQAYQVDGFTLSSLALQVADTNYDTPRLQLSGKLEGGVQLRTEGGANILTLRECGSFNGFDSQLTVPLEYRDGKLKSSLKDGSAHELKLGEGTIGQERAAEMFRDMLSELDAPRAQLGLADVQVDHDNALRRVREIQVRAQVDGSSRMADGVPPSSNVLLFVKFEHGGPTGRYPEVGDTFPYLLGSDGKGGQGCTALMSRHMLHRVALTQSIMDAIRGGEFEYGSSVSEPLPWINVSKGVVAIERGWWEGTFLSVEWETFNLEVVKGSPLRMTFEADQVTQVFRPHCELEFSYRIDGMEAVAKHTVVVRPQLDYSLTFDGVDRLDEQNGLLTGRWLAGATEPAIIEGLPEDMPPKLLAELQTALEAIIRERYLELLSTRSLVSVTEQLLPFLRLFDTRDLRCQDADMPNNLVMVGGFETIEEVFQIQQQDVHLASGQSLTFDVMPARPGLTWRAELLPEKTPLDWIDEDSGRFSVPAETSLTGVRSVRVVAQDPVTRIESKALVSINPIGVMMAPMFQLLKRDSRADEVEVSFTAVSLEDSSLKDSEYRWEIVDREEGVSGSFDDANTAQALFTAGTVQRDRTYVVDKIRLTNTATGVTRDGIVLSQHAAPELTVVAGKGTQSRVTLEAYYGEELEPLPDMEWIVHGKGSWVHEGGVDYYQADPQATDPFVLIIGQIEEEEDGHVYQGHVVVPLPLDRFPEVRAAQARRKRQGAQAAARTAMHLPGVPEIQLVPNVPQAVAPGHRVRYLSPPFDADTLLWKVERIKGDPDGIGSIDQNGLYTAGKSHIGQDRVVAEFWLDHVLVGKGTAIVNNMADVPVWADLKTFDLKFSNYSADRGAVYGNGHMQLELGVTVEASAGQPIDPSEMGSLCLFSKRTKLQIPERSGPLSKDDVLWAFDRSRNEYNLSAGLVVGAQPQGVAGINAAAKFYLLSRAELNSSLECYGGIQDLHGAWFYSERTTRSVSNAEGNGEVTVGVAKHTPSTGDFSITRKRVWPPERSNEDEDFDLVLESADYWLLKSTKNKKLFQVKIVSKDGENGAETNRTAMAKWEDHHSSVEWLSYTGWAFWSALEGKVRPATFTFDSDLWSLSEFAGEQKSEGVEPRFFNSPGLQILNRRADGVPYPLDASKRQKALTFEGALTVKVQDDDGNTVAVEVRYVTDPVRHRDLLEIESVESDSEW